MKYFVLKIILVLNLLILGCSSIQLPNITIEEVASICDIDANQIEIIKNNNQLEFKIQKGEIASQSLWIEVGPSSKKHFEEIKQIQSRNNLKDYPEIADGAFAWTIQNIFRRMLIMDGRQTYRIDSIIDGCNTDEKLIEIANTIISK
ncbi:MAG: hypothetical protein ACMXX8_00215 [Candidatus Woesearchaeota archaeon]